MVDVDGYKINRELGSGATARVYEATDSETGQSVSLKIFHPGLFKNPESIERMKREMELALDLNHDQIVAVKRVIPDIHSPLIVMEYVDGESLESFQGRLPYILPEVSLLVVIEILKGLEYAHSKGVIHRDLKPENILVSQRGRVLLTDFGLAKFMDRTNVTQPHSLVGTIDYMSPEQVSGDKLTSRSDLFSVAAVLYFLVTGTRPFARPNSAATLKAIQSEEVEEPQKRNPKIPMEISELILKGLKKNPEERYENAREFRFALIGYLESIGLKDSIFTFFRWKKDTASVVIEALRTSAEMITERAETSLKQRQFGEFLKLLKHLGLKAPETPALSRLTLEYQKILKKKKRRILLIAFFFLGFLGGGVTLYSILRTKPIHNAISTEKKVVDQPVIKTAVSIPPDVALVKPLSVAPRSTGTVIFKVEPGVKVFWDGKPVDVTKPLKGQKVGTHKLLMEMEDAPPIRADVEVVASKPTVINAN